MSRQRLWDEGSANPRCSYYSPLIFQSLGLSATSSKLFATGVYGVVRFVATLFAMLVLADRFGRRSMIIAGGSMMAICIWIVGALVKTYPPVQGHTGSPSPGQLGAIVLIYIWAVAFCVSVRIATQLGGHPLTHSSTREYHGSTAQRSFPCVSEDSALLSVLLPIGLSTSCWPRLRHT